MSNLDLIFQKPTPAAGVARASSAAAPARKSGAATGQSRGGRDFDDLMSRLADEPPARDADRASASRPSSGVRENAPPPRDKRHGDVSPADSASTAVAQPPSTSSSSPAPAVQNARPQGETSDPSRHDAQDSGDQPTSGRVTNDASGAAATMRSAAQAAAQAAASATALLLGSTQMPANVATAGGPAGAAGVSAAGNGATDSRTTADVAAQGPNVDVAATVDAAAAAAPGPSAGATTPGGAGQAAPTPADLDVLAAAAASANAAPLASTRSGEGKPTLAARIPKDAPPAPSSATLTATRSDAASGAASVTPETAATPLAGAGAEQTGSAAGYQPAPTAGAGLPDAARQQASSDLRSALARMARAVGQNGAPDAAAGSPATGTGAAGATGAPSTLSTQAANASATASDAAAGAGIAASAVAATASTSNADRLAASKAADQQGIVEAAAPTTIDAALASTNGQAAGGDTSSRGGAGSFAPPVPQPVALDLGVSSSSTAPAFDPRGFGVMPTSGGAGVDPFSGAAASTPLASTASPMTEADSQQIIRGMRLQWRGPVGEAQLTLRPDHLGQVTVTVRVDRGAVSATLRAETPAAQQWMQAHQQDLRQALQQQGLEVTELVITTDPDDRQRRGGQAQDEHGASRQRQPRGETAASQPRFEIRV